MSRIVALQMGSAALMMSGVRFAAPDLSSLSLADMAEMETDDIQAIQTILFPIGLYGVKVTAANLGVNTPQAGELDDKGDPKLPLYYVNYRFEVLVAKPTDPAVESEPLVGRSISERHVFWPNEFSERIGLLKGRYEKVGFSNAGKMGGVEGAEPGWLDSAVDQMLWIKVTHGKPKADGSQPAYYDWLHADSQDESDGEE